MNKSLKLLTGRLFAGLLLLAGVTVPLCAQDTATVTSEEIVFLKEANEDYLYFDLGCNSDEWGGYFSPDRWQRSTEGPFPVGFSPLVSEFVEGGDNSSYIVFGTNRTGMETWSIEIPATGYLAFQLLSATPSSSDEISVHINGEPTSYKIRADGAYYSPYLMAGDVFSINIPAGSTAYHWSQLRFHSNFTAVIVRPQEPTIEARYVPIRQGRIQRVLFPSDEIGTWPVFDQDGDPLTLYDQIELRCTTERFELSYEDTVTEEDGTFYLQRTFTIKERCRRGNWLRRSRTWAVLPIIGN